VEKNDVRLIWNLAFDRQREKIAQKAGNSKGLRLNTGCNLIAPCESPLAA